MEKLYFTLCIAILTLTQVWEASGQSVNPVSENIDKRAFEQEYSLDDADVVRLLTEFENANETGGGVTRVGQRFLPIGFNRVRCEDGPVLAIHQQHPNVLSWPPMLKRTCTGLFCRDPWCLALKRTRICRWAIHYTVVFGKVKLLGIWRVCYETHLKCECRKCKHIRNIFRCLQTRPCPNGNIPQGGHCYWRGLYVSPVPFIAAIRNKRMGCDCCYPKSCIDPMRLNPATCRCECKPQICPPPQILNPDTCMCECKEIRDCPRPLVWDPDECKCVCNSTCLPPKVPDPVTCECNCSEDLRCDDPPQTVLNYDICECECPPVNCTDPKIQNPTTCACECPSCPPGSIPDDECNCIGNCSQPQYHGSDYCEMIHCKEDPSRTCTLTVEGRCECPPNSCEEIKDPCKCNNTVCPDNNSLTCRFYHDVNPITGRDGCQCNDGCCQKQSSAPEEVDCSIHDMRGADSCNSADACAWRCDCSDIDDPELCLRSSCLSFPRTRCEYSNATGCVCPRCCTDHPSRPASVPSLVDCSVFDTFGERICNSGFGPGVCQWSCPCNVISNQQACLQSTCTDDSNRRRVCQFETDTGACFCS